MPIDSVVDLSRLQFAATAMYHFLFVPLTLGMVWLLVIMESVYVMTGKLVYKDMTRFWGKLFGINFALGVTTGITLEFQFGTNWAYYSHYVGDIFGAPLAIEGLMAFFLESTFIGLFFFGWDRLSRRQHLLVTILMAVGTNLSALWILIANGWMQNPVGAEFSYTTMRMEMTDFWAVVFNPDAQAKFVHTVSAGYVTGAMFVLAISSWYLLRGRNVEFAKRSFRVAAAFGLASVCSVIVLGDESGYMVSEAQKTKMAAIEAMWNTEPAPAGLKLIAGINELRDKTLLKLPRLKADAVPGQRSGSSKAAVLRQFDTLRTLIRGADGKSGLADYLDHAADKPVLARQLRDSLEASRQAIAALPEPLTPGKPGAGQAAAQALKHTQTLLENPVTDALGITVSFNESDGD